MIEVRRVNYGWTAHAYGRDYVFMTFEGLIGFLYEHLAPEQPEAKEHYFETCCGACGANVESD